MVKLRADRSSNEQRRRGWTIDGDSSLHQCLKSRPFGSGPGRLGLKIPTGRLGPKIPPGRADLGPKFFRAGRFSKNKFDVK